jgi:DNA repair protein RadC
MESIYELIKIKQIIKEVQFEYTEKVLDHYDAFKVASYFIGDNDREVFLEICLNSNLIRNAVHHFLVGSLNSTMLKHLF